MENQYVKQFPDLLKGKTLMYVHGFASSGQSGTVTRLRTVFPNTRVGAPDVPIHPVEAQALLQELCAAEKPDIILGTSMGGMYVEQLYGFDRICMNPALCIADTMQAHGLTGTQTFQNPRLDGVQQFSVDKAMVKEYRVASEQRFSGVNDDERQRVFGLFGDEDDVVDTFDLFNEHYPQAIRFHGEHRINDRSFMHSVVPVIRWIDDRQEKRERNIVFIGIETMADSFRNAASSCQKAVRMLIETYRVYFVAPAPTHRHWDASAPIDSSSYYADVLQWLEQWINVPAWDHTVFTNQRGLLYGDYVISSFEVADSLATNIVFGGETFKTWEDIIDYFSRLGGQ